MRAHYRASARLLWHYRATLSDHLTFDPAGLDGWGEPNHAARGENRTARIDETVIGPLIAWALRFTDDFALDILKAAAEGLQLHAARLPRPAERCAPARWKNCPPAASETTGRFPGTTANPTPRSWPASSAATPPPCAARSC